MYYWSHSRANSRLCMVTLKSALDLRPKIGLNFPYFQDCVTIKHFYGAKKQMSRRIKWFFREAFCIKVKFCIWYVNFGILIYYCQLRSPTCASQKDIRQDVLSVGFPAFLGILCMLWNKKKKNYKWTNLYISNNIRYSFARIISGLTKQTSCMLTEVHVYNDYYKMYHKVYRF